MVLMNVETEKNTEARLSKKDDWEKIWDEGPPMLTFDPENPFFSDIHSLLKRHLPRDKSFRCLEVGCYPGTYLWYFSEYFGYQPYGLEYVEKCAEKCRNHMHDLGLNAKIYHADLFSFTPEEKWDVVFSVGFIEHFTDTRDVVRKHLDLLKPGGYLVLIIPNHSGLNGKILKAIDKEKYDIHNHMNYDDMKQSVAAAGKATIIAGGYYGHMGFWNTDLYPWLQKKGRAVHFIGRVIFKSIEYLAKYIVPDTAYLSPNCTLIARKSKNEEQ